MDFVKKVVFGRSFKSGLVGGSNLLVGLSRLTMYAVVVYTLVVWKADILIQ